MPSHRTKFWSALALGLSLLACGEGDEGAPTPPTKAPGAGGSTSTHLAPEATGESAAATCEPAECAEGEGACDGDDQLTCQGGKWQRKSCDEAGCKAAGKGPLQGCLLDDQEQPTCLCGCTTADEACVGGGGLLQSTPGAVPVAFAVDKQSVAWINYSDGSIHRLDMVKLDCEKTAYEAYQHGWQKFAMTFNNDPSDPSGESILVADLTLKDASVDKPVNGLGKISTGDLKLKRIGDFDGAYAKQRPLITGRGDGRLFAIFIDSDLPRRSVTEIDPASAKILSSVTVPAPRALYGSFAHWGGAYYYFYSSDEYTPSSIARYVPGKGMKVVVKNANRILYGSSVSTCAPTSSPDIK